MIPLFRYLARRVTGLIHNRGANAGWRTSWRACMAAFLGLVPWTVQSQSTPEWSAQWGSNPPASTARGSYYNSINFTSQQFFRDDATINFDWGTGTPVTFADQFSVRWTGRVVPRYSQPHTFYARSDDGCRVWLNNQLIIDAWFDQLPTEHASAPILLAAGSVYSIRVDYYEKTGGATIRLSWASPSLPKQLVTFQDAADGTESYFGTALVGLADGKLVASAPRADLASGFQVVTHYHDAGFARLYDATGLSVGFASAPLNNLRRNYGKALAAFTDGRFLVGAADSATHPGGTATHVGTVYLHGNGGELLATWPNPDGATNQGGHFGHTVIALPGDRFAASSLATPGKVFVFDAAETGAALVTLSNPTPILPSEARDPTRRGWEALDRHWRRWVRIGCWWGIPCIVC
jgi:hypothetical protein